MSLDDAPTTEPATADRRPSRAMAALCGVLAGALGLGIAELIAGLVPGAPSPVLSIGALLITLQPPNAKQLVVDLFGTNDKAVLSVAVVIGRARPVGGHRAARAPFAGRRPNRLRGTGPVRPAGRGAGSAVRPGAGARHRGGGHRGQRLVAGLAAAAGHAAQRARRRG